MPGVGGGRIKPGPRADLSGGGGWGLPWQSALLEKCGSRCLLGSWGHVSGRARSPTPQRLGAPAAWGRPRGACAGTGTCAATRATACPRTTASAGAMGVPTR